MFDLLPQPKKVSETAGNTQIFKRLAIIFEQPDNSEQLLDIARIRLSARYGIELQSEAEGAFLLQVICNLADNGEALYQTQGYKLTIAEKKAVLCYSEKAGFVNGIITLKRLLKRAEGGIVLPLADIEDWPSVEQRAVAPTFSWYAGYGRIGFDMQLWGYDEWISYIDDCLDNKINQLNLIMYGYWPFKFEEYPETVFENVPIKIWNKENRRWLTVRYSHPNIEDDYLPRLIEYAHSFGMKFFAYVGLNSYNGAYSIKHPEKRMVKPAGSDFMNDFDSICLSDEENIEYILASMRKIAQLGFDGFTLEESEEGFWFCECDECKRRWHSGAKTPGEAKHKANMWLLRQIYDVVRAENPLCTVGIRAYRQPPLEKDPEFLRECVQSMPDDIELFWAPGLYVPPTEFEKWIAAFGAHRISGRDTESNSITSTMGRLFRIFESNVLRYNDEPNAQVIERDIEMHISSVEAGVKGINGFMFEWYGLFMHQWAHGNYGWGSKMDMEEFFALACKMNFGEELGKKVLYALKHIVTIHESQMPLYTTPFPFQSNKMTQDDIPAIMDAKTMHEGLLSLICEIKNEVENNADLAAYIPHFCRIENAQKRNAIIYDMILASLRYEEAVDEQERQRCLDEILYYNEKDFELVKDMFFDINPVGETGVKSCMYPYHEIKRIIHNLKHPESADGDVICSGIEALGWLWL